ncbi:MAG: endonuclease III [Gemmatimonadota bacterium]|jgi:endonuclease-3|nr:endonuclease III [Gemmatimonadota bacterium]MDQ8146701.1 endonuclease III [Gemmatimonadota bacterium]MDQ8148893.1 endonuclease III [Gemmatimonadota bacterium]MDQ8176055.1 endonuclease III [Gemmatimonadota bacterium]
MAVSRRPAPASRRPSPDAAAPKPAPRPRSAAARLALATEIQRRLAEAYPDAHCELDHRNAFELAVATVLSAQCTDKRVNMVTPELFRRWPTPATLAEASLEEIEDVIRSTGFYRNKAKSIQGLARALVTDHGGEVPAAMDALVVLPGIGRKTANVVLGNAFGMNEGVVVDTHVARLSARFGLTRETDAVRIERALMPLFARETWAQLSHLLIWHGRRVCDARRPRCGDCLLNDICPSATL